MARQATANEILNRCAVEVGLNPDQDPVASIDETFVQMEALLNSVGQELFNLHDWQELRGVVDFTTKEGDTGIYDLPSDFDSMIDQTGWDRTNRVMLGGPLSAQDWTYLEGRDLVSSTIYASFRLADSKLYLFPQPPPVGLRVTFEYVSRGWVQEPGTGERKDYISNGSDVILYDPLMTLKFLKLKWLQAKGLPAQNAAMEFDVMLESRKGKSEGAAILSASRSRRGYPYLNNWDNVGDTGFGGV